MIVVHSPKLNKVYNKITIGKQYSVIIHDMYPNYYYLKNDIGKSMYYLKEHFIELCEFRNEKIKKLGI